MVEPTRVGAADQIFPNSSAVGQILRHLCEGDCRAFGDVLEWCEARGDCWHAVVCPTCGSQFVIEDDELDELRQWTARHGNLFVCGIRWND
jgi:hypothetical protein